MLSRGLIEKGHAKLLASLTPEEAERIAIKTSKESLSIKDLSSLVSKKHKIKTKK